MITIARQVESRAAQAQLRASASANCQPVEAEHGNGREAGRHAQSVQGRVLATSDRKPPLKEVAPVKPFWGSDSKWTKNTLSRYGIGPSQQAKAFAMEFTLAVEARLAVGVDVRVARR
jgi:hypothetical protein